jgi:hypothetical protein
MYNRAPKIWCERDELNSNMSRVHPCLHIHITYTINTELLNMSEEEATRGENGLISSRRWCAVQFLIGSTINVA